MEIYTNLVNKEIEEALTGGLEKLWEVVSSLDGDDEFQKIIETIKSGVKVKFDIRSIVEGEYQKEVAFGRVKIERKLIIDITEYRDEIDERKKLMKDLIRDLYTEDFDNQKEVEMEEYDGKY